MIIQVRICHCRSVLVGQTVVPAAKQAFELAAKVVVHERIDDGIGDVVREVHVEDDHVVVKEVNGHEEGRQKRHDEHDGDHEQHGGCLEVGDAVLLAITYRLYGDGVGGAGRRAVRRVCVVTTRCQLTQLDRVQLVTEPRD